ncbi:hypothetical protein [Tenacibaculum agarivorans]|uniref:hypothetical protein n=1 Tax=Tenacibaculum agarivorans TaxID=1908389 RepID=UPI00094B7E4C|nr:hypothetical protein [Tenacibaculum agarivorans]
MKHTTKRLKSNQRRSVPTLHKNGELAVFYNLAYNRTSNFIRTIQRKDKANEFTEIRQIFFPKHFETGKQKENIDWDDLNYKMNGITDRTYSELKVFFWNTPKGNNIRFITPEEIKEINHILLLLLRLRDYHSHYWHEETAISPSKTARVVLDRTYKIALASYQPKINFALDVLHYDTCWNPKKPERLSTLGIDFFLSFFLTRGQMELYMKSRQYLNRGGYNKPPTQQGKIGNKESYLYDARGHLKKRKDGSLRSSEDIIDLEKSKFIASFYAQRDASESAGYWLGKHSLFEVDALQYHLLQLRNYLGTLPLYLHHQLSEETAVQTVCRIHRKPTTLLATSIAYLTEDFPSIAWRVHTDDVIQKKVSHATEGTEDKTEEEIQKIPAMYYTQKATYTDRLGITKVTADRLQHDTETVTKTEVQVHQELYEKGDRIMIRIEVAPNKFMHISIGYQNLKHWGALIGMSKTDETIATLQHFASDFMQWLQYLSKPSKKPFFINSSYLKHFNGEKNADGSCKYSSLLPKILLQLQNENLSNTQAMEELRMRIQQKLQRITNPENKGHFAALVAMYNTSAYASGYFEKKEQEKLLKKLNRINNLIKAKEATELDFAQKSILEREWKGKTNTSIRHEKMQLIYKAIEWILGKQGRFISAAAKKQFAKYCYLLDDQRWKEVNKTLIADWLNVACTAKLNPKKHENDFFENYQSKVLNILEEAHSFDACFKRITQLAIDKYKAELEKLSTYDRYENLIGLARRLHIANPSNEIQSNNNKDNQHADRKSEILAPFLKKEKDTVHGYIHLPHDFFLITPETKGYLKNAFKDMPDTTNILNKLKAQWQKLSEHTNYQNYFADFKTLNTKIKTARNEQNTRIVQHLKEQRKQVKQLYESLYTDTVLTLLQGRLLQNDARLPMGWKEHHLQSIRSNAKTIEKIIDGITISFPVKQLKSHDFYNMNRIEAIVKRLKQENPDRDKYEYKDIKTALQLHWKESIAFVSQLLTFEKDNKKTYIDKKDDSLARMGYISFKEYETNLGKDFTAIEDVRNKALHADILPSELSYTELTNKLLGLKKQYKKRSYSYQKPHFYNPK